MKKGEKNVGAKTEGNNLRGKIREAGLGKPNPVQLFPSFAFSLSLSLSLSRARAHTHTHSLTHSLSLLSHTHAHVQTPLLTVALTVPLTHTHTHAHTLSSEVLLTGFGNRIKRDSSFFIR